MAKFGAILAQGILDAGKYLTQSSFCNDGGLKGLPFFKSRFVIIKTRENTIFQKWVLTEMMSEIIKQRIVVQIPNMNITALHSQ